MTENHPTLHLTMSRLVQVKPACLFLSREGKDRYIELFQQSGRTYCMNGREIRTEEHQKTCTCMWKGDGKIQMSFCSIRRDDPLLLQIVDELGMTGFAHKNWIKVWKVHPLFEGNYKRIPDDCGGEYFEPHMVGLIQKYIPAETDVQDMSPSEATQTLGLFSQAASLVTSDRWKTLEKKIT